MTLSRASLLTTACVLAGFGVYGLVAPKQMMSKVDIRPRSRRGVTELRAMYGGFELGLGAFFAVAAFSPEMERAALWAQLLSLTGLAGARMGSLIYDRPDSGLLTALCAVESAAAVVGGVALKRAG